MFRMLRVCVFISSFVGSIGICVAQAGASPGPSSPMITGTVTYLVRMALPPDAAIDVRLEDVSRADAPATVLAENMFAAAGKQVPIPFQLPYSAKYIQPSHRYNVRARITVGDKLLFTTTQSYPVITNGAPTTVNLVLQPASNGPTTKPGGAAAPSLRGTNWRLVELNGQPPAAPIGSKVARLMLDDFQQRYSGSTGCNSITGAFELDGTTLHFKAGAMTMMACPEPLMTQEQAFTAALQSATTYHISGSTLELSAGEKVVARFKAEKPASK
ncbi:MAG: YbaY family lipoprotein [Candidatus Korobacteraceae bacterium]